MNYRVEPKLEQREMAVRYVNAKGESRVHGGKDLKASQNYPAGFPGLSIKSLVCLGDDVSWCVHAIVATL